MVGASQGDRALSFARRSNSRSHSAHRRRTIRRYSSGSAFSRVDVRPVDPHEPDDIERSLSTFAPDSKGGLIVTTSRLARVHRELIVALAARHRLPAVYAFRVYVAGGGLMFYGPDAIDPFRRAADYIDRILRGAKPADLPVQAPTKYELV